MSAPKLSPQDLEARLALAERVVDAARGMRNATCGLCTPGTCAGCNGLEDAIRAYDAAKGGT